MDWKVGFKVVHPFNPDWGIGEVTSVGPLGRSITVFFPRTDEHVTLSTHNAAFTRWTFPIGSRARLGGSSDKQEVWLLERLRNDDGHDAYRIDDGRIIPESQLKPLGVVSDALERLKRLDVDPMEQFESRYAGSTLDLDRQASGLGGMLGARVTLFPHQLHVAYHVARKHPVRALLADEVGLGKTIEAGMIYSALRQAGRADRVLILTPDVLAVQWLGEMYRKFHDVFVMMDEERILDAQQDHPDLSPWTVYPHSVCSLAFLSENKMLSLDASEIEGGWDLVIVDEAHHLRYSEDGGNDAYQVVDAIASNARSILLLTATPMELDRREYFGLLRLLQPTLFHDLELFEIQLEEISIANEIAVALEAILGECPTQDESEAGRTAKSVPRDIPKALELPPDLPDIIRETFPEQKQIIELAAKVVEGDRASAAKMLDSLVNLHPLGETVFSNTRARVGGFQPRRGRIESIELSPTHLELYGEVHRWVEQRSQKIVDPRSNEARSLFDLLRLASGLLPGLKQELLKLKKRWGARPEGEALNPLLELCELVLAEESAQLDRLLEELRSCISKKHKLLVFVHHQADLLHLRDRIEARVGVRVAIFHENLPAADRDIQVAMFRSPEGYPVLLSTEAGGEGRNFQFCHKMVHFDLPPSPNRVEQRIGRLDRIGQQYPVQSIVIVARETVEHEIVQLMHEQLDVFQRTIGGLDPVLEDIGDKIVTLSLSKDARKREAWQALGVETRALLDGARDAITRGLDHLIHRGGYDPSTAEALQAAIPETLEERLEEFVVDFCEQTGITVHEREGHGTYIVALDRYTTLDGLPGVPLGTEFMGTFYREQALDREDHDFLSTGHPLVEGVFNFLRESRYGTTTLRKYRRTGLSPSVGLQFNYRIELDVSKDVDASVFLSPQLYTVAVDLDGTVRPDVLPLLTARHSRARPMEIRDVEPMARYPRWLDVAANVAEEQSLHFWNESVNRAVERFDRFQEKERLRLEAYFEHRLDSAEARLMFGKTERMASVARAEIAVLKREWKARLVELDNRRAIFQQAGRHLDSASLYVIE